MATRRPTRAELDDAAAYAAFSARTTAQAERALRVFLAVVIAILLTLALVHWATPCTGAALCAGTALPMPAWVERLCRRLHVALLQARINQLMRVAANLAIDDGPDAGPRIAEALSMATDARLRLHDLQRLSQADAWLQQARRALR